MFDNIGGKFKGLAKVYFWSLTGPAILAAIAMIFYTNFLTFLIAGIPGVLIVALFAWVSSWFIYVIGEIVDILYGIYLVSASAIKIRREETEPETVSDDDKLKKLKSMRMLNLITEEEFQAKRAEIVKNL